VDSITLSVVRLSHFDIDLQRAPRCTWYVFIAVTIDILKAILLKAIIERLCLHSKPLNPASAML
jgi:hypothetical protein